MTTLTLDLEGLSVADSERLLKQGFAPADLISLYHNTTPVVANDNRQIISE